jgi:iron complex transport system ATP-binding protein
MIDESSRNAIVELKDITLIRGETTILSGVSWRIEADEHWVLLGANGSGKTTLLKVITGYEWATEGSVEVLGNRYGDCNLPELRKAIGWVSAAIEQRLPGRDTAVAVTVSGLDASMGLYREISDAEWERARIALDQVGAAAVANRAFGLLSQGEQQRVLIARALVNRPALLILDEPCVGLDPGAREGFLEDLARMAAGSDAPTLILVTHHIEEIGAWIERALVLKEGRVLASGRCRKVLTDGVLRKAFGRDGFVEHREGRYLFRLRQSDYNRPNVVREQ